MNLFKIGKCRQADAKSAHNMQALSSRVIFKNVLRNNFFTEAVSVTNEPIRTAPENSKIEAIRIACFENDRFTTYSRQNWHNHLRHHPKHYKKENNIPETKIQVYIYE